MIIYKTVGFEQHSLSCAVVATLLKGVRSIYLTSFGLHVKRHAFIQSPEAMFLLLGMVYGILFVFFTPPFQVADETNHFYRAYQMSEGRLVAVKKQPSLLSPAQRAERDRALSEVQRLLVKGDTATALLKFYDVKGQGGIGGLLPESLVTTTMAFVPLLNTTNRQSFRDISSLLTLPLNEERRTFIHFPNTALYSPLPYLPQAFGIAFGKMLHSSPLALMYLGRIANLFIWGALVYFAIKITPIGKWFFFLLALMPMSLSEAASLSADGFTYGISFLLVAVFLRNAFVLTEGSRAGVFSVLALSLLLSLSKQAYFLVPLLFLLIPVEKIGTKKRYYAIFLLICLVDFSAILFWTLVADVYKDFYTLYSAIIPAWSGERQILFILSHPLQYCSTVITTFIQNGRLYMDSFVGQLGQFDTALPEPFRISFIGMLFVAVLSEGCGNISFSLKQRIVLLATLLLSILLVSTLAFIGWSAVGSKSITLHGRYFIPLAPLFFLLFYNKKTGLYLEGVWSRLAITGYAIFSLAFTLHVLADRYYIA